MIYIDGTNTIISIARIKQTYNHQSFDSKQLPKEDLGSDEIVITIGTWPFNLDKLTFDRCLAFTKVIHS